MDSIEYSIEWSIQNFDENYIPNGVHGVQG